MPDYVRAIEKVLVAEGGFQKDPDDPGNWTGGRVGEGALVGTKYGIAASAYPNEDIENMTKERAAEIYKRDYWDKVHADDLPVGLNYLVFDAAVNQGPGAATRMLQDLVGADPDGVIGPNTLAAVKAAPGTNLADDYGRKRWDRYQRTGNPKFLQGWRNRLDHALDTAREFAKEKAPQQ